MSKKINNGDACFYYSRNPVYANRDGATYLAGVVMGSVWLKAVARQYLKKKYGISNLNEKCDECKLCLNDKTDIDEE